MTTLAAREGQSLAHVGDNGPRTTGKLPGHLGRCYSPSTRSLTYALTHSASTVCPPDSWTEAVTAESWGGRGRD